MWYLFRNLQWIRKVHTTMNVRNREIPKWRKWKNEQKHICMKSEYEGLAQFKPSFSTETFSGFPLTSSKWNNLLNMSRTFLLCVLLIGITASKSGIVGYGICQSGCNCLAVACYAAAGFTFGTVTAGAAIPAVIVSCNAGLGTCMASCIVAGVLSGPI